MTRALPTLVEAAFRATDRHVLYRIHARRDLGKLDFSIAAEANDFKRNDSSVAAGCKKRLITLHSNTDFSLIALAK